MAKEQESPAASLTFEQLKELLDSRQAGVSPEQIADIAATAAAKAKKPENPQPTGVSVYNPAGGPKPELKCRMYLGEGPIERVTCSVKEIEALNKMEPGAYRVQKTDGSTAVVEVRGRLNANHEIERMWIVIPDKDEGRNAYGTLVSLVEQFTEANRVQVVAA